MCTCVYVSLWPTNYLVCSFRCCLLHFFLIYLLSITTWQILDHLDSCYWYCFCCLLWRYQLLLPKVPQKNITQSFYLHLLPHSPFLLFFSHPLASILLSLTLPLTLARGRQYEIPLTCSARDLCTITPSVYKFPNFPLSFPSTVRLPLLLWRYLSYCKEPMVENISLRRCQGVSAPSPFLATLPRVIRVTRGCFWNIPVGCC